MPETRKATPEDDVTEGLIRDGYLKRDWLEVETVETPAAREQKIADELRALHLLAGFRESEDGELATHYFREEDEGTPEELEARTSLARIVRANIRGLTGEFLALAIDPITPSTWPGDIPVTRKIKFLAPSQGPGSTYTRDQVVIAFMKAWLRNDPNPEPQLDAALHAAEAEFKIKRRRLREIWEQHVALRERLWPDPCAE
jgi:hypothetical protein